MQKFALLECTNQQSFALLECISNLVASEDVAGVDFVVDVVEAAVVAVGYDGVALGFELFEVVDHLGAEEGLSVGEGGLIDDYLGALGPDALHHSLDGTLAEVVGVGLHCQAVDSYDAIVFLAAVPFAVVAEIAGFAQDCVSDVVFPCAVALDYSLNQILRNVGVVCKELLGVFRETVAAVAEGRVIVVGADARVQANSINDGFGVEALDFGVGVKFVEVAHAEG